MNAFDEDFVTGREESCLSDLALDRFIAGEFEGTTEGWRAAAHLRTCTRCESRRAEFAAAVESFPSEIFVEGLAARAARESRKSRWPRLAAGIGSVAAAAAAVVLLVPGVQGVQGVQGTSPVDGIRTKGGGALSLIARTADGAIDRVLPGDTLAPGDAIRFEVATPSHAHVAIVGIDQAQAVTPYVAGAELEAGPGQVLPGSILLDGTLGSERIVAFFCQAQVPVKELVVAGRAALSRAGGDPAAELAFDVPGCSWSSMLIRKGAR